MASRRRGWKLATAVLAPLLFLSLFEIGLRVAGVGGDFPLFVEAHEHPGSLRANEQVMRRYFPGRWPKVSPESIYFRSPKPPGVVRIVVQGGSSAAGFPYGRFAGLAGMLGARLEAAFPEREIEVISTAMAAVNSFTLLDFVDEIVAIEPDAVLIYAGHNEYLGVLGVGSVLTPERSRTATLLGLRLRGLRVYQCLQMLVADGGGWLAAAGSGADAGDERVRDSMMAQAAAGAEIPFGSEIYHRGIAQLDANLSQMLERYRDAGVPVFLGTLVSNERDQPPFAGGPSAAVDREEWKRLWEGHRRSLDVGDLTGARDVLSRLLALDEDSADVWFARGRLEQQAADGRAARDAYQRAIERDRLRFRAPSAFDELIRRLAPRTGATLVDVREHLANESPDSILGQDLFLEHLHPNARGYFLLADAYYEALRQSSLGEAFGDWSATPSRAHAEREMPVTAIDRILAAHAVRELRADFPFRETREEVDFGEPRNEIEALALRLHREEIGWLDAMQGLLEIHRGAGRLENAAVIARMAARAHPGSAAPSRAAGVLLLELGRPAEARRYLERSLRAAPESVAVLKALVEAERALGDREGARLHLARLRELAPVQAQRLQRRQR